MKLAMTSGQIAAEFKAIPGDLTVLVEDGDSRQPAVDLEARTVTIFAPKPKTPTKKAADVPATA